MLFPRKFRLIRVEQHPCFFLVTAVNSLVLRSEHLPATSSCATFFSGEFAPESSSLDCYTLLPAFSEFSLAAQQTDNSCLRLFHIGNKRPSHHRTSTAFPPLSPAVVHLRTTRGDRHSTALASGEYSFASRNVFFASFSRFLLSCGGFRRPPPPPATVAMVAAGGSLGSTH